MQGDKPVGGVRFWQFSTNGGSVEVRIPDLPMSAEDFELFSLWIALVMRSAKRRLVDPEQPSEDRK